MSEENSNFNHINVDNNTICLRDECESFSKSTNIDVNLNSCCLNNSKIEDTMLSSNSEIMCFTKRRILSYKELESIL